MSQLAELIAPQPVDHFLSTIYAKTWAHYPGRPDRFKGLAGWGSINEILATQRFETPRFRVTDRGVSRDPEQYTEEVSRLANPPYRRIVASKLLDELNDGATVVFDRFDQSHLPTRGLTTSLESELRAPVWANIYASLTPVPGFGTHADDHDVFVIQLEGAKHWRIFGPTRQWPLYRDVEANRPPDGDPLLELDVTAGDVLYVPHGWWHEVTAIGGPSLHLSVGVSPAKGIDLLTWLVDRARSDELFRRRLPQFEDTASRSEYIDSFRDRWNELMGVDDLLEKFFAYSDGTAISQPRFMLPEMYAENTILDKPHAVVTLLAPRAVITPQVDQFVLAALGRRWTFPAEARALVECLISNQRPTVSDVLHMNSQFTRKQTTDVMLKLLRAGVIGLEDF
jgi:ribosomal protein L16 Arg81 hydroxylase